MAGGAGALASAGSAGRGDAALFASLQVLGTIGAVLDRVMPSAGESEEDDDDDVLLPTAGRGG